MGKNKEINVRVADFQVAKGDVVLVTNGLGSCVGLALYDANAQVAGLAHILLDSSKRAKTEVNKAKFADTAVGLLLKEMEDLGANRKNVRAKIVGGSKVMFTDNEKASMGERNVKAVKKALKESKIPIISEDTGGKTGRTMYLFADGKVKVKLTGKNDIREI